MVRSRFALGLDFGGSKLAAGVVDLEDSCLVDSAMRATRAEAGAEGAVGDMIEMARGLEKSGDIGQIGICFGGLTAHNQIIKSWHVAGWEHFPIHERLHEHFGNVPIFVANDANAVALGEFKYGAGRGCRSMLFLTVSTGVGGGVILDGRLWEGAAGIAGEIGHMKVIAEGGPPCSCGRFGCVESVSSGPSMVRQAHELLESQPDLPSALRDEGGFTGQTLDLYAEQGDVVARQIVQEGARYLGIAIGNAVNLLDVECVVIGGGVSRSGPFWWRTVRTAMEETLLVRRPAIELKPSALGADEGIWGAVALLPEDK